MDYVLTREERETTINFNEASKIATIETSNAKLQRKLAKFADEYPELCKLTRTDEYGVTFYELKKDRLSINFKAPITEEARQILIERGKHLKCKEKSTSR